MSRPIDSKKSSAFLNIFVGVHFCLKEFYVIVSFQLFALAIYTYKLTSAPIGAFEVTGISLPLRNLLQPHQQMDKRVHREATLPISVIKIRKL